MAFESCTVVLFHLLRRMLRPFRYVNVPGFWSAYSSDQIVQLESFTTSPAGYNHHCHASLFLYGTHVPH